MKDIPEMYLRKMKIHWYKILLVLVTGGLLTLISCRSKNKFPSGETIDSINLKRGDIVLCGPPDKQFGQVEFETSCSQKVKADMNLAISLLHSFEYDEAEKVFAKIIDEEPDCAMAYWGVAMSNWHPLWAPPTKVELEKGSRALEIAQRLAGQSGKESGYIHAIASYYEDWNKVDHWTRAARFEKEMEELYSRFPRDKEAAVFYALSLDAAAKPTDTTFASQRKAGAILDSMYLAQPNHPGIVHYLIHSYDYPELAAMALPAARKYASIAPSSAHAQHMPSHIFVRLGLWDECIQSNLLATAAAVCYGENSGISGHWDEELHGIDYLVYGYLQKGQNDLAKKQWDYLKTIKEVSPVNFKGAYCFAAVPARYVLENKLWKEASQLEIYPANFPWKKFPWQEAITHFARALGALHTGEKKLFASELNTLINLRDTLMKQKDSYSAGQVDIQIQTARAWVQLKEGNFAEAIRLMSAAADLEDQTAKHPVTPGEVIPARELLGDMLLAMNKPDEALQAYEIDLKKHPKRFNGLYGAGLAARKMNEIEKAKSYFQQLLQIASSPDSKRPELDEVRTFFNGKNDLP